MTLTDKVVLVTGGSQGIGASLVRLLVAEGAKVSATALPSVDFLDQENGSTLLTAGDITCADTRRKVVGRTREKFGRIDVLINNAGVGQYGYPSAVDTEISKRLFDINVLSPLALAQLVIPEMRARKSGVIVNIGSVGGRVSLPWAVMYCATKWALHCIDDSLRRELARSGIRVIKICPGIVDTDFRQHVLAGQAPQRVEDIRRVVSPDQVASAVIRGVKKNKKIVFVPRIGFVFTSMEFFAPWLMDWYVRRKM